MIKKLAVLCIPLLLGATFPPAGPLELKAGASEITSLDFEPVTEFGAIRGAFRFTRMNSSGRWAPSAFIGFRDHDNRAKFRIFLYQTDPNGLLSAGYDYVVDDRVVKREILHREIHPDAALKLMIQWSVLGEFRVTLFDRIERTIDTGLGRLVPFVAVSAGSVKYSLEADMYRSAEVTSAVSTALSARVLRVY